MFNSLILIKKYRCNQDVDTQFLTTRVLKFNIYVWIQPTNGTYPFVTYQIEIGGPICCQSLDVGLRLKLGQRHNLISSPALEMWMHLIYVDLLVGQADRFLGFSANQI